MSKRFMMSAVFLGVVVAMTATSVAGDGRDNGRNQFNVKMVSFEENPTLSTTGRGRLNVRIDEGDKRIAEDDSISYVLRYSRLEGGAVLFSHIHLGQRATNGGVVAFLCGGGGKPACPQPVGQEEIVVRGVIVAADIVGPVAQGIAPGEPTAFAEFVRAIHAGYTYGNLHTEARPSGEIRGQLGEAARNDHDDDHDNDRGGHGDHDDHDDHDRDHR
jgi:hypothetical protein